MGRPLSSTERSRRWRASGKGREDDRRRAAESNPRRVWVGGDYVGTAKTIEHANNLNAQGKDFRDRQKQSTETS